MNTQLKDSNYDKLQAFTDCVTNIDQNNLFQFYNQIDSSLYNRFILSPTTPPTPQYHNDRFYTPSPIDNSIEYDHPNFYNNNTLLNHSQNLYSISSNQRSMSYPNLPNNQNNNLMLLSQFIEHEKMNFSVNKIEKENSPLIGSGEFGRLTKEEEINFIIQNPNYLSSTLPGEKINRQILNQLFYKNLVGRFECKFCNQNFKRVNGLKRHIMMHLEIKPYKCDKCFRAFSRIDVFKRHLLRTKCMPNN